jgi:hypothetical protein
VADTVAKVENRSTLKISQKPMFKMRERGVDHVVSRIPPQQADA